MRPSSSAREVLSECRRLAIAGRVRMENPHVRLRMAQRNVRAADVFSALRRAAKCGAAGEPGRWKVTGPDIDDDDLTMVIAFEGDVIVITVF